MKKKTWTVIGLSSAIMLSAITGCANNQTAVSADELIERVIETEQTPKSYSAEMEMKVYEADKLVEHSTLKEYVNKKGQIKTIGLNKVTHDATMALNNGKQLISYDEATGKAFKLDISASNEPNSQKDQVINLLKAMKKTHNQKTVGAEKINGFQTPHLKLEPKSKKTLIGQTDLWIDTKTWFVIKTETKSENRRSVITYKDIDFSPSFKKNTFTLDIPKGVAIESADEQQGKALTIEEAGKHLGKPFLMFPNTAAQPSSITADQLTGEIKRTEVNIEFKKNQVPYASLSIFPTPAGEGSELDTTKGVMVRGQKAEVMEEIDSVSWDEDGLRYVILPMNPDVTTETLIQQAENMQLSNKINPNKN
ncbi:LolA family protein [Bacillus xiapuensis]|uniref:LolA family protein n=1 Tax=Bacillus xiapuensis TaxID=2014075 RepID=UPI000C241F63|nr:hypothetical protein [Bacillus xiapuensis]